MTTKDILKELRRNKSLSAQQVADGCDMSLGVYKKYESGERGVGTPALLKLADFYNVTTDYLLGRPNAKPPADPVEEFADRVQMQEQEQIILKKWLALDEKQRRAVYDFMVDIVHEYESVQSTAQKQIQKSDTYNSEWAIARSSNSDFLNVPDEETEKTFTRIEPDPDF